MTRCIVSFVSHIWAVIKLGFFNPENYVFGCRVTFLAAVALAGHLTMMCVTDVVKTFVVMYCGVCSVVFWSSFKIRDCSA